MDLRKLGNVNTALVEQFVLDVSTVIEALAAIVVGVGALTTFIQAVILHRRRARGSELYEFARIDLGRQLALGLELEVGSDLLKTAINPTWNHIGILASIIAVRSVLNFLLQRDIEHLQRRLVMQEQQAGPSAST